MAVNIPCHTAGLNRRLKTQSIGSPDPMDAFLGCYETGSDFEDDEWMIAELIEPDETFTSNSSNKSTVCEKKSLRHENVVGNVEYKFKLINPTAWRFNQLVSQLQWRLREGQGEATYHVGFDDDGLMQGLTNEDLDASIKTLTRMADNQDATVTVFRRRPANTLSSEEDRNLFVAEVLIRKAPEDQATIRLRVAVLGDTCAGKSTLISVLINGKLDNGNGSARIDMFRHKHEIQSGYTSSVNHVILGFDSDGSVLNYQQEIKLPIEISDRCSKLLTFIDLAGKEKYFKTMIRGLSTHSPHYFMLIVSAHAYKTETTDGHLRLALGLKVPFFIVLTKQDLVAPKKLEETINQLKTLLTKPGFNKVPFLIGSEDDLATASNAVLSEQTVPIFVVSSKTGFGKDLLMAFLHRLPPGLTTGEREKMEQEPVEFKIYETFSLSKVEKPVFGGLLTHGILSRNMKLKIGPFEDGSFRPVEVQSIERYKYPCRWVRVGQYATLGLDTYLPNLRRGMILCDEDLNPKATWSFQATLVDLFHAKNIHKGFQTTVYIGNIHQDAVIEDITAHKNAATEGKASVRFRFMRHPEIVREDSRLLFRTGKTYGIGNVTEIFYTEVQHNQYVQDDCEK